MREGERKIAEEALIDLRGSLNAVGRAMRVINGIKGMDRERERLRGVETQIRETIQGIMKLQAVR